MENFDVCLHAKNQVYPLPLSWNITKILQTCYFGYSGCTWQHPPKVIPVAYRKLLMFICKPKINLIRIFFLEILHFKESCNLGWSTRGYNSRTWILPGRGFVTERQELKEFSFCIAIRENNGIFKNTLMQNTLFLVPFCPNLNKTEFPTKIGLAHFLASIVP